MFDDVRGLGGDWHVERFVQFIVAGGLALVAGLWVLAFTAPRSLLWLGGIGLALVGVAGLTAGIATELDVDRS